MKILFLICLLTFLHESFAALNVKFNQTSSGRFQLLKANQVVYDVESVWMQVAYNRSVKNALKKFRTISKNVFY